MTTEEKEINDRYFNWMYKKMFPAHRTSKSYKKLLKRLHELDFLYMGNFMPMDINRADDGLELRYRFGDDMGYDERIIAHCIDIQSCSILEMMVALAIRIEEHIMCDEDAGDRTGLWFEVMLKSMGLDTETDSMCSIKRIDEAIYKFKSREYEKNGKGGLFTVNRFTGDMRRCEIWEQACHFLTENYGY